METPLEKSKKTGPQWWKNCERVQVDPEIALFNLKKNEITEGKIYTVSQKNDNDVAHYNFNAH